MLPYEHFVLHLKVHLNVQPRLQQFEYPFDSSQLTEINYRAWVMGKHLAI